MSLQTRMAAQKDNAALRENTRQKLYKNEREYRAAKYIDAWSRIPKIGAGLAELPLEEAQNVAINLNQQASFMSRLNEAQLSQSFTDFTPENMLRLVRLAMPNIVRNKIFTEFAMESARDSIKYIKPVFAKTQDGLDLNDKHTLYGRENDPWGYDKGEDYFNSPNVENYDTDYQKAMYETTEDRSTGELINAPYVQLATTAEGATTYANATAAIAAGASYAFVFEPVVAGTKYTKAIGTEAEATADDVKRTAKWGTTKYLKGYTVVYGKNEKDVIAVEDKRTNAFFIGQDYKDVVSSVVTGKNAAGYTTVTVTLKSGVTTGLPTAISCYARCDLEDDFTGTSLGEVALKMTDYEFRPRPTTIGVSWSQLAEITLDASFGVSAQEYLVQYAAQAIRVNLDYRAIKLAYLAAKTNKGYTITFDAAYNSASGSTLEGYIHNAQTFMSAVDTMSDVMLNDINRGGVSRMVAGPSAGTYCRLAGGFTDKGKQPNVGVHQVGEFEGIPLFKAPSSIIPNNEILTVWKNDQNEADVSIAFGTLVPFFNTGVIQRKQFYKEAGIASYGDWALLNRRYLGIIKITGLKDNAESYASAMDLGK